ncbi:hypothetical protein QR680_004029 [Steinernema hermaphroditum]|uniref:EF-hand domain-containing protein n=1 Tax=Steinernema hermaphroditum TaxID=289476 RepID=A0AA39HPN6_9BILA|nr:hypothetical protein QR680_004029 [Steinernema hermaphroditum]
MLTVDELKTIYAAHDVDQSGTLDKEEARKAVIALGENACHLENFDAEFDKIAKDGVIDVDGFMHFAKGQHTH